MEISTIDISKVGLNVIEPSLEAYQELAPLFRESFSKIGFAYISNHGIDQNLIDDAFKASKSFFELPQDVKEKSVKTTLVERGYVRPGQEIFDAKEDWTQASTEVRESFDVDILEGPSSFFPDEDAPAFRPAVSNLAAQTIDLGMRILKVMALSLNLDVDFFTRIHTQLLTDGSSATTWRSLFYPPLTDEQLTVKDIVRCGAHSDYGSLTLLYQDDLGGLEVRGVDHSWIDAKPIPGTILINMGDLLENFTNGLYPATRHRVMVPESEYKRRSSRQSMVLFVHPDNNVQVQPLPGINGEPKYQPVNAHDYVVSRFQATYS